MAPGSTPSDRRLARPVRWPASGMGWHAPERCCPGCGAAADREFTRDEVEGLYAQHTADTGQVFAPEAVDLAFQLTCGQPWLVNALAPEMVDELVPERTVTVQPAHVRAAPDASSTYIRGTLSGLMARPAPRVAPAAPAVT